MKIGVNLKIDVTKIDKALLHKGKKGTYLDAQVFVNLDEADQYGNHGMITQAVSKEAREAGEKGNILGNAKIFWNDSVQGKSSSNNNERQQAMNNAAENFDDDIPF